MNSKRSSKTKTKQSTSSHGGYAIKKKPKLISASEKAEQNTLKRIRQEQAKAKAFVPVPNGIKQALSAMSALARSLKSQTSSPFAVSIEPYNDSDLGWLWRLVVRGYEPTVDSFEGYAVRYQPSTLVKKK